MKDSNFNPEEFLGAKIVSPLEQEKLIGGIGGANDSATVEVVFVGKLVFVPVFVGIV